MRASFKPYFLGGICFVTVFIGFVSAFRLIYFISTKDSLFTINERRVYSKQSNHLSLPVFWLVQLCQEALCAVCRAIIIRVQPQISKQCRTSKRVVAP